MSSRRLVLAAYDVTAPHRLRRALKVATAYSSGGQKSCHEAWTSRAEQAALGAALDAALKQEEDAWALFMLGREPRFRVLGRARAPNDPPALIFGWGGER